MSRRDWSTSNFLRGTAPITAGPLTMACWGKTSITATAQAIMGLFNSASVNNINLFRLLLSTGDAVQFQVADGSSSTGPGTTTTITANTWFHACGVYVSATSYNVYLNGGGKMSQTVSRVPSGIDRFSIGVRDNSTITAQFAPSGTGDIAWPAIWNVALGDADVTALAAGADPRLIRPDALVAFWPLIGANSPENNLLSNSTTLAIQGTLSQSDSVSIFRAS